MFQYKISIDNITIMGYPTIETLKQLEFLELVDKFWTTGTGRYHYNYSLHNGGFIQIQHESNWLPSASSIKVKKDEEGEVIGLEEKESKPRSFGKPFRLEFNPNRYKSKEAQRDLFKIIRTVSNFHFSRRDIALDIFNMDMNDFNILDFRGRKRIEYKTASHVLETLYLGSGGSDDSIRIYNKAKEQGLKGVQWWRIEGQLRGDSAKEMYTNPFKKMKIVVKNGYGHLPIQERAMLLYLQANPDGLAELSKNSRKKYKELMVNDLEEISLQADEIFVEHMEGLKLDCESWLTFSRQNEDDKVFFSSLKKTVLLEEEPKEEERLYIMNQIKEWLVLAQ